LAQEPLEHIEIGVQCDRMVTAQVDDFIGASWCDEALIRQLEAIQRCQHAGYCVADEGVVSRGRAIAKLLDRAATPDRIGEQMWGQIRPRAWADDGEKAETGDPQP